VNPRMFISPKRMHETVMRFANPAPSGFSVVITGERGNNLQQENEPGNRKGNEQLFEK
jgi:hypothetical protein